MLENMQSSLKGLKLKTAVCTVEVDVWPPLSEGEQAHATAMCGEHFPKYEDQPRLLESVHHKAIMTVADFLWRIASTPPPMRVGHRPSSVSASINESARPVVEKEIQVAHTPEEGTPGIYDTLIPWEYGSFDNVSTLIAAYVLLVGVFVATVMCLALRPFSPPCILYLLLPVRL